MSNQALTIASTAIHQDNEGRFNLNELHKAAGGAEKHKPTKYLQLDQAGELLSELKKGQMCPVSTQIGRNGGTFAVKELVYAYAMWISPAFHLKVIRAYDQMVTNPQPKLPQSFAEALRLAADTQEQLEEAEEQRKLADARRDSLQRTVGLT